MGCFRVAKRRHREIYTDTAGPLEGLVREPFGSGQEDYAFGGKLEPRVRFGRADLIADGITHYLWSVRPLGGAESEWTPLNRQVIRHYTTGAGTAPVEVMGPEAGGSNSGRFKIRPVDPPTGGIEWLVADEREDLATAHFVTRVVWEDQGIVLRVATGEAPFGTNPFTTQLAGIYHRRHCGCRLIGESGLRCGDSRGCEPELGCGVRRWAPRRPGPLRLRH